MGTTESKANNGGIGRRDEESKEKSRQREERANAAEVRAEREATRGMGKSTVRVLQYVLLSHFSLLPIPFLCPPLSLRLPPSHHTYLIRLLLALLL